MSAKPVVVVAMSGGVDSSVAAALLIEQGYTVIGMMLRLWSDADSVTTNRCCSPDSMAMARRIAAILSIPFYVLDARQFFYEHVVKSFLYDYAHNLTPNPCISCNRIVRWDYLLNHAIASGANYLATGHYARLHSLPDESIQLLRGIDPAKDQSYVLHVLAQKQLHHSLFPLGDLTKAEVRQLAHQFHLPVAEKPDSQDLCFLGANRDYRLFLRRSEPESFTTGPIIDQQGNILGYHQGLPLFTIGQRKGLHISSPVPLYVLEKDLEKNTLVVGMKNELGSCSLIARNVSWVCDNPPDFPFEATVKIRYKAQAVYCVVSECGPGKIRIELDAPARDVTPGQAAVLYNGEVCLGGGVIADKVKNHPTSE
jgi:tRNA-uridine 2-sulfurtransferase